MIDNLAILISHGLIFYVLMRAVRIDRHRGFSEFERPERDFNSDTQAEYQTKHRKRRR